MPRLPHRPRLSRIAESCPVPRSAHALTVGRNGETRFVDAFVRPGVKPPWRPGQLRSEPDSSPVRPEKDSRCRTCRLWFRGPLRPRSEQPHEPSYGAEAGYGRGRSGRHGSGHRYRKRCQRGHLVTVARAQARLHLPRDVLRGDFSAALAQTGPIGLHRTFYRWSEGTRETRNIQSDHAARRMPWISFKPPFTTAGAGRLWPPGATTPTSGPRASLCAVDRTGHRDLQPRAAQRRHRYPGRVREGMVPYSRRHAERDRPQERCVRADSR